MINGELKISVIVPVYNEVLYLEECVSSICNQTYENLEIILVDDGSSSPCREMCDEYADRDKRIRVIHKENGGSLSARRREALKKRRETMLHSLIRMTGLNWNCIRK